ncbi:MAG: S-layer homology domain-containing protein [Acidimicrobiia bacterium]|nr:S-layer homology domain-containing protein [Acidimicrobiia bacterium]MDX2468265.1 S-layer homology domain-containing protein [Acidimicrobiia bacterium]
MKENSTSGVLGRKPRLALAFAVVLAVMAPVAVIAAGGTFVDDDTSIFEGDIEWMAANGITSGCGPDTYCPEDNVTRGQMAAFMKRLATKKVVDAATAVTADSATTAADSALLDGLDSTDLLTTASGQTFDWFDAGPNIDLGSTPIAVLETTINAVASGALLVSGAGSYGNSTSAGQFIQWIEVDDGTCTFAGITPVNAVPGTFLWVTNDATGAEYPATSVGLVEVDEGAHKVSLCASQTADDGDLIHGAVTGLYVPTGAATKVATSDGATGSPNSGGGS